MKTSFDLQKIRVLLLEGVHPVAEQIFRESGYTSVESLPAALDGPELIEKIRDAHFVGIRSRTRLTDEIFRAAKKLIGVGCFCIGTNQVDLISAKKSGIPVFNAPFSNTRSVAELVVAEAVLLLRGIPRKNALAHRGKWMKSAKGSREARGKTFGIIGYGHIGSQAGILAESFGMRVIYFDIESKLSLGNAVPVSSLSDLLQQSDVVSLHVPETPETANMIGKNEIVRMKEGSILINAARGSVIDIDAVAEGLKSGRLAGAAVDVFPDEPASKEEEFRSPLREWDEVILSPHVGGSTLEAQESIGREVAEKLVKYSDNGSTLFAVNFPQVSLPEQNEKNRFLHIHRNVPGVLGNINRLFSDSNVNISGQYLQTDEDLGYVVIDTEGGDVEILAKKLREIPETIKSRILY
jgi:D-3-phosphoglycerate dehydrogenase